MAAAYPYLRQRVVQAIEPFVAAAARLRTDDTGGEVAVFGQIRRLEHLDILNTVDRNTQAEAARRRIGHVNGIDDQNAVLFSKAGYADLPVRQADDARNQRKNIRERRRPKRTLRCLRNRELGLATLFYSQRIFVLGLNGNHLIVLELLHQLNLQVRVRVLNRKLNGLVTSQLRRRDAGRMRRAKEGRMSVAIRDHCAEENTGGTHIDLHTGNWLRCIVEHGEANIGVRLALSCVGWLGDG